MAEKNFINITLLEKKLIANSVHELRFEKPDNFNFNPGQFVQFKIPFGKNFLVRSYSIASSPDSKYLEFCIKSVPNGKAGEYFNRIKAGEIIQISEAKGIFSLKTGANNIYFIATGVGITPIISMIEHSVSGDNGFLLFGVRSEADLFWKERLEGIKRKNPNFGYRITLSNPSENWAGLKGRVTDHLIIDKEGHYYICGSVEMVKDVRGTLLKSEVNTKNVHFEIF